MKLYSAPRTRSLRVAWLLEELGVEYELVNREFKQTDSSFFIQDTPTGKFPTLVDDQIVLFESGAICEYLLEKYDDGSLAPRIGEPDRGEFLQWMYFSDATAFSPVGVVVWLCVYRDDSDQYPALVADAIERATTGLRQLSHHIENQDFLLGEKFSAADIMVAFTLIAAQSLGLLASLPVLDNYLHQLQSRSTFLTAAEKTGNLLG